MRYFSMFSGIGGFELGIQRALQGRREQFEEEASEGQSSISPQSEKSDQSSFRWNDSCECVGFSEIDRYAIKVYQSHFPTHKNYGDATRIVPEELPDFDLLCGGFPCQAFSIAGKRRGFNDTRGTLFFEIARILKVKRPRLCLLENVKGLLSHDNGRTFKTIISALVELGYCVEWQVINSKNHGVPQNRERVFIIGHRNDTRQFNVFPLEYRQKEIAYEIQNNERVYWLSEEISKDIKVLSSSISQSEKSELSKQQMQEMLLRIKQGLSQKKCREISSDTKEMDSVPEGMLQVVEELNSWTQGQDKSRTVYGMVSIPTEEMLVLWDNTRGSSKYKGQIQQQSIPTDCGSDGQQQGVCFGESGSLLLAVQPYQGRLFYSIGNGRDWTKIYTAEVETKCTPTLSSILEESVDERYFLSDAQTKKIMSQAFEQTKRITDTGGGKPNGVNAKRGTSLAKDSR